MRRDESTRDAFELTPVVGRSSLSGMSNSESTDWRSMLPPNMWNGNDPEATPPSNVGSPSDAPMGAAAGVKQEDMSPPSDGFARIPCLAGPCKHFMEIAQVTGLVRGENVDIETRRRYRYCRCLTEESGTMTLHEFTFRYCTNYAPPLLSLDGWAWKIKSSHLLMKAALRSRVTPSLKLKALHELFKLGVKHGLLQAPNAHDSLEEAITYDDDAQEEGDK